MARWRYARRNAAMLESRRLEGLELLRAGRSPADVARRLSVSRTAVGRWRRRADRGGPSALRARPRAGRRPTVDRRLQAGLGRILAGPPRQQGFASARWTLSGLTEAAELRWGYRYSRGGIWRILRAQGFRWRPAPDVSEPASRGPGRTVGGGEWVPGRRVLALLYSDPAPSRRRAGTARSSRGLVRRSLPRRLPARRHSATGQVPATENR